MAGSIKTGPVTKEYAANFARSMRRSVKEPERAPGKDPCEHCGRVMKYADQHCACTLGRGRQRWG